MKFFLSRYREALVLFALLLPSFGFAETLSEFTTRCENELQIPQNSITGFDCSTGRVLPTSEFGSACDAQALLGGVGCTANSRLGVQSYSNPDVKGVWVCRKYAGRSNPDDQQYYDIAMIVHNRQNGKTCFFQNKLDNISDGPIMPSPKATNALNVWSTPQVTAGINCTSCHLNDPYLVTPHVAEALRNQSLIRFNPKGPYSVVGPDFAHFNSQIQRTEGCGGVCHFTSSGSFTSFSTDAVNKQWMLPGTLSNYTHYNFNPIAGQFYSLGSNGEIRGLNGAGGGSCNGNSCPHWSLLDSNPNTVSLAASSGVLFQRHNTGQIYQFKGAQCSNATSCPSWQLIDNNPRTAQIVSGSGALHQRWNNGPIFSYTGTPCSGSSCPGWRMLDNNPFTVEIAATAFSLYQLHSSGAVYRYTGTACSGNSCPGWQQLSNDTRNIHLIADSVAVSSPSLYRQTQSGAIWKYTGTPCNASGCTGWQLVDSDNPNTKQVVAGDNKLYRLYNNGQIWRYSGSGQTWTMLDNNAFTREIVASSNGLLQRHASGAVYRFTGTVCSNGSCPGWTLVENFSNTVSLTGARQ